MTFHVDDDEMTVLVDVNKDVLDVVGRIVKVNRDTAINKGKPQDG